MEEKEEVEIGEREKAIKMEHFMLMKDQEDKLKEDLNYREMKSKKQAEVANSLMKQRLEKQYQPIDGIYLNSKEFGINRALLTEIADKTEIRENEQSEVLKGKRVQPRLII